MNKLDTTQATTTKGQPLLSVSAKWMQDSTIDMINGIISAVLSEGIPSSVSGVAVYGCEDQAGIISSGYMTYQGELYAFDGDDTTGYSNIPIVEAYNANGSPDPIAFSDGSTGNVHNIRRLRVVDGLTGSGEFDYADVVFLNNFRLLTKVIEIGDWDMDTTASVIVAHGITTWQNIRSIDVWILEDGAGALRTPLSFAPSGAVAGYFSHNNTDVLLDRVAAGFYDSTSYNQTTYNRGYITIQYVGW